MNAALIGLQLLTTLLLIVLQFIVSLANYWYTFGLWPRSWGFFIFFALCQLILISLMTAVGQMATKAGKKTP